MSWLTNASISKKIMGGYIILAVIMAATVLIALSQIRSNQVINERVFKLRMPTVLASTNMLNGVNWSLAGLRGWMILGKDKFKQDRTNAWKAMDENYAKMQTFSENWTNPENVRRLNEMGQILKEFKVAQQEIEAISGTIDNTPANKILFREAAPRAAIIVTEITNMIDIEAKQEATVERKALLGMMADVRGTMGLSLANIRAYLLSGDEKFKTNFDKLWAKHVRRYGDLSNNTHLFTAAQRNSFNKMDAARNEFKGLPPQMFEIRGGNQWNLANYWLGTKAAPRAAKINEILGAMVINQNQLAATDVTLAKDGGENLQGFMLALGIVAVIIALVVAFFVTRMITVPVAKVAEGLKGVASGDLTKRWVVDSKDELGNMLEDLNQMSESLTTVVTDVISGMNVIQSSSGEVSEGNINLSQRTEEQASSLEETASSMEEMTSTVTQNADNANTANQLAIGARDQAEKGGEVVGNAINAMAAISESSKKIADIISVIDEIAFQTNLLALNAAVEAARAGEQGRGFAVVATEVRTLAQRSATAAKEIKELINDSVARVEDGSKLVGESGETLEEIVTSVKKVSTIVAEIAAASQEQSAGIEQVNKSITQMDDMTQQNASLVEEAAAAAKSMSDQAVELNRVVGFFQIEGNGAAARGTTRKATHHAAPKVAEQVPHQEVATLPKPHEGNGSDDSDWREF